VIEGGLRSSASSSSASDSGSGHELARYLDSRKVSASVGYGHDSIVTVMLG
jgi:hypothetical protein